LKKFENWLTKWDSLQSEHKGRFGKLSKETAFALRHTTSALIKLANYLLEHCNFSYVLLGKFQTDPLESRFGRYRQMSGSNYNVSVDQVLEREKKLKVLNLISLSSKYGHIKISDLKCQPADDESDTLSIEGISNEFSIVLDKTFEYELSDHEVDVMTFISGYVCHSVSKKLKCTMCSDRICQHSQLIIDELSCSNYLSILSRGGLKYPTEFTLSIYITVFKIFQCILNEYEDQFIRCNDPRKIIMELSLTFLQVEEEDELCPSCKTSTRAIYIMCSRIMSNILLNNYTKV